MRPVVERGGGGEEGRDSELTDEILVHFPHVFLVLYYYFNTQIIRGCPALP